MAGSSPQAAPGDGASRGYRGVVAIVFASVFLNVTNASIVSVILPSIGADLDVEPAVLGWVVSAYSLVYAVSIPFYGRLADRYGARRFYVGGQAVFALGSLMCVLAPSFGSLIAARVIQSAAGAAIPGLGISIAARVAPQHMRATILGLVTTAVGAGQAIGPTLGGWLATTFGWHAAFMVGVGAAILVPASWALLPRDKGSGGGSLDVWGGAFLAAAITGGLLTLTEASQRGLFSAGAVLALTACLGGAAAVTWRHRRVRAPFIARELLASRGFLAVGGVTVCAAVANLAIIVGTPLMLARVNGLSPAEIGLVILPYALVTAFLGVLVGRLADRVGSRLPARIGLALMLAAMLALSSAAGASGVAIGGLIAIAAVGAVLVSTPIPAAVAQLVPPERLASGQSMNTMLFFLGGSLGATITTAIIGARASAADALNPLHTGAGAAFSDAYLFGTVAIAIAAALTVAVPGRTLTPDVAKPPTPPSGTPKGAPLAD